MISLFFGELYNYPLGIENSDSEEDHGTPSKQHRKCK